MFDEAQKVPIARERELFPARDFGIDANTSSFRIANSTSEYHQLSYHFPRLFRRIKVCTNHNGMFSS